MNNQSLSPLELSTVAKGYYKECVNKNTYGMEKYVATDGKNTMFVKSDYEPGVGESVFYIKRVYGGLSCQLYKTGGVVIETSSKADPCEGVEFK